MAVTKIKPIRGTVNKAIAYILDPQKTDDAFYVSSYGCAASDAAAKEFEWTRNLAVQQGMQMPKVLARHLIQSFDIGEVTPEEAHEVGKQLADEWLKGKYEYVIATHIDKGHCHNIISNRKSDKYNDTLDGWVKESDIKVASNWKKLEVTDADLYTMTVDSASTDSTDGTTTDSSTIGMTALPTVSATG